MSETNLQPAGMQPMPERPKAPDVEIPKVVLRARDTLGLSKKRWDKAALAATQQFGKWLTVPVTAKILLTRDFSSLDQIENAHEYCAAILARADSTMEQKLAALEMQTLIATAQVKLTAQIMELAEKSGEKAAVITPKNLPPQIPLQVNIDARGSGSVSMPQIANSDAAVQPER